MDTLFHDPLTGANLNSIEGNDGEVNTLAVNPTAADGEIKIKSEVDIDFDEIKKEESKDQALDKTLPLLEEQNDMFDDVDGPEYVDQNYEGIAEVDGVDYFVCEEFKIRQVPKPVIITRPLCQLFDCILSEHIILDPEYQRDVIWDEGRAAMLISSILMGYFIPPIIFNVVQRLTEDTDGKERLQHKRICVDGKQRLTSVWKFMTGQIGFFDSNKPQKKWYFCNPTEGAPSPEAHRNILPISVKEFFKNQVFCCYEYDELTPDTEETMFQLVQKGIAMTPAEKMRAMSTEWAALTKEFEDNYPTVLSLSKQLRGSAFRLVLTIFAMIQEVTGLRKKRAATSVVPSKPILQASQATLTKILEDRTPIDPELIQLFRSIFDKFAELVMISSTELTNARWKINRDSAFDPTPLWLRDKEIDHGKSFAPIELIATAILITVHMERQTNEELLEDIMWMRHYLRTKANDLRVNIPCWRIVWEFISSELNTRRNNKVSMPAFLNNYTDRTWAKRRKIEDQVEIEQQEARLEAKAANARARSARYRQMTRARSAATGASSSSNSRSLRNGSKSRSQRSSIAESRSSSQRQAVVFPKLRTALRAQRPSSRDSHESGSSSLTEPDVDANGDECSASELSASEEEALDVEQEIKGR